MALIYSYQLYLTESMDVHNGIFTNMQMPTSSYDSANKKYVDDQVSAYITSSNSFLGLLDTPKTYNQYRVLFEGTSSVIDSANFTFETDNLLNVVGSIKASQNIFIGNNSRFFEESDNVIKTDDSLTISQLLGFEETLSPNIISSGSLKLYFTSSGISPNKEIKLVSKIENEEEIVVLSRII